MLKSKPSIYFSTGKVESKQLTSCETGDLLIVLSLIRVFIEASLKQFLNFALLFYNSFF